MIEHEVQIDPQTRFMQFMDKTGEFLHPFCSAVRIEGIRPFEGPEMHGIIPPVVIEPGMRFIHTAEIEHR